MSGSNEVGKPVPDHGQWQTGPWPGLKDWRRADGMIWRRCRGGAIEIRSKAWANRQIRDAEYRMLVKARKDAGLNR